MRKSSYLEGLPELVGELGAPDGGASLAGTGGVAALDHEALDVAVEDGAVVVAAGAEGQEILRRAGHLVAEHLALDVAQVRVQRHRLHPSIDSVSVSSQHERNRRGRETEGGEEPHHGAGSGAGETVSGERQAAAAKFRRRRAGETDDGCSTALVRIVFGDAARRAGRKSVEESGGGGVQLLGYTLWATNKAPKDARGTPQTIILVVFVSTVQIHRLQQLPEHFIFPHRHLIL